MNRHDYVFAALFGAAICFAVLGFAAVAADHEDCRKSGGIKVFSHYTQVWIGKTLSMVPIYKCSVVHNDIKIRSDQ